MSNLLKTGQVNVTLTKLGLPYAVLAGPSKMATADASLGLDKLFSGPLDPHRDITGTDPEAVGQAFFDRLKDIFPVAAIRSENELTRALKKPDLTGPDRQGLFTRACGKLKEEIEHDLEKRGSLAFIRLADEPRGPHRLLTPNDFLEAVRSEKPGWQHRSIFEALAATNLIIYLRCLADLTDPGLLFGPALAWPIVLALASGSLTVHSLSLCRQGRWQDLVYRTFQDWQQDHPRDYFLP